MGGRISPVFIGLCCDTLIWVLYFGPNSIGLNLDRYRIVGSGTETPQTYKGVLTLAQHLERCFNLWHLLTADLNPYFLVAGLDSGRISHVWTFVFISVSIAFRLFSDHYCSSQLGARA